MDGYASGKFVAIEAAVQVKTHLLFYLHFAFCVSNFCALVSKLVANLFFGRFIERQTSVYVCLLFVLSKTLLTPLTYSALWGPLTGALLIHFKLLILTPKIRDSCYFCPKYSELVCTHE